MAPIRTTREFGSAIRRARRERGLSQSELAGMAGVGRPWLSELESGKRTAELGRALAVLHALGLAISFVATPDVAADAVDLGDLLGERS